MNLVITIEKQHFEAAKNAIEQQQKTINNPLRNL